RHQLPHPLPGPTVQLDGGTPVAGRRKHATFLYGFGPATSEMDAPGHTCLRTRGTAISPHTEDGRGGTVQPRGTPPGVRAFGFARGRILTTGCGASHLPGIASRNGGWDLE